MTTQAPTHARPDRRIAQGGRDPFLDNAKFLAIILVVIGHAWTELRSDPTVEAGYLFLFLFHMPVFVLLTGFVTRPDQVTPHRVQRLAVAVGVPYVVFSLAYRPLVNLTRGEPVDLDIIDPPWLMWFLLAVLVWRLTAAVWLGMRGAVLVAVAVSVVGGTTGEGDLAIARVLGFLPFFVLGIRLRREHFDRLHTRPVQVAALALLTGTVVACWLVVPVVRLEWVYWRSSYAELGVGFALGALTRLGLIGLGVLLALAFLALVPRRGLPFSGLGSYTMYAYLLHGFIIMGANALGVPQIDGIASWQGGVVTALAALVLTVLLTTKPVRVLFRPVVEPDLSPLWHHHHQRPPRDHRPA